MRLRICTWHILQCDKAAHFAMVEIFFKRMQGIVVGSEDFRYPKGRATSRPESPFVCRVIALRYKSRDVYYHQLVGRGGPGVVRHTTVRRLKRSVSRDCAQLGLA